MSNTITVGMGIIQRWEKCRLKAFIPVPGDPPTVGWGATGPGITIDTEWTQQQADADLANRCAIIASQLRTGIKVPTTDNQFGAIMSLAYNEGISAILGSTLLRKLNAGDIQGAANQFLVWTMAHGKELQGLLNRRKDERNVFLT